MWRPEYSRVRQAVMSDAVGPAQPRQCRSFPPFTSTSKFAWAARSKTEQKPASSSRAMSTTLTMIYPTNPAQMWHYFIGEKSVGCMYVTSTFSVVLLACSDLTTS
jgi:hypothetical protein